MNLEEKINKVEQEITDTVAIIQEIKGKMTNEKSGSDECKWLARQLEYYVDQEKDLRVKENLLLKLELQKVAAAQQNCEKQHSKRARLDSHDQSKISPIIHSETWFANYWENLPKKQVPLDQFFDLKNTTIDAQRLENANNILDDYMLARCEQNKTEKTKEDADQQHPVYANLLKALFDGDDSVEFTSFNKILLDSFKPDFVHVRKGASEHCSLNFSFVSKVLVADTIDDGHKGKLVVYLDKMLEIDPFRHFTVGIVTNLIQFQIVRVWKRRIVDQSLHEYDYSCITDFATEGIKCIDFMMRNPDRVGFRNDDRLVVIRDNNQKFTVTKCIGQGVSSCVYKLEPTLESATASNEQTNEKYVIKIMHNHYFYDQELEMMNRISSGYKGDRFVKLVQSDFIKKFLILSPLGRNLPAFSVMKMGPYIQQIFDCVRDLRDQDIIHRDLAPHHFQVDKSGKVFLIDFGCAIKLEKGAKAASSFTHYQGTMVYAAKSILEILEKSTDAIPVYTPCQKHDLESLVRTLMTLIFNEPILRCDRELTCQEQAKAIIDFWDTFDRDLAASSPLLYPKWAMALNFAKQDDFENLEKHFKLYFM